MYIVYIPTEKPDVSSKFKFPTRELIDGLAPYVTRAEAWEEVCRLSPDERERAVILNKDKVLVTLAKGDEALLRRQRRERVTQLMAEHRCTRAWAYELLRREDPSYVVPEAKPRGPKPKTPRELAERQVAKLRGQLAAAEARLKETADV